MELQDPNAFFADLAIVEFDTVTSKVVYTFRYSPTRRLIRNWENCQEEVPTSLLMKQDGKTLDSFGYKAESRYIELVEDAVHTDYYYFKGIKGLNHYEENKGEASIMIEDESGKKLAAVDVFALMISSLVTLDSIRIKDLAVLLVLPVDASPAFIKLMTDAMKKAGVDEKKRMVIKSSEAASVLFKNLLADPKCSTQETKRLGPGTEFLTIILGEESVGTVIHKIEPSGQLREIGALKKGPWGFVSVLDKFEKFLEKIVGNQVYKRFKCEHKGDWYELMREVKIKLIRLSSLRDLNTYIRVRIPLSLNDLTEKSSGRKFDDIVANSVYKDENHLKMNRNLMEISFDIFKSFYEDTFQKIIATIQSARQSIGFQAIMMVGVFGDALFFKETIKSSFPDAIVVSPMEAALGVLEGAFIYAHTEGESIFYQGKKPPLAVASIDFGTTFSGWSRLYRHAFVKNPITPCQKKWPSDFEPTPKAPTCVLLNDDGKTVVAFGYNAINRYNELLESGEHESFYFFRYFKMTLNKKLGEKLDRDITIEDELGRPMLAMDVFAACIRYLKQDFFTYCEKELTESLDEDEIQWVLTVPAIWSDGAKQFMREAAIKAGIKSRRLLLALEPEAASIYCRHLPVRTGDSNKGRSVSTFTPGTKYLVLDAGGGTIDITVHEVQEGGKLKEICAPSGGGWGGMMVNGAFENLIKKIVGESVYSTFCKKEIQDHLEFMQDFEKKKKYVSLAVDSKVQLRVPMSLVDLYEETSGNKLEVDLAVSTYAKDIRLSRDKLTFSAEIFRSFFQESIEKIMNLLHKLIDNTDVEAILMVGGYSDSPYLQETVKNHFPKLCIVVPEEAVIAVMAGALIYGHMPRQITERVLKYTYGISVLEPFQTGIHSESKRLLTDSGVRCKDVFDKHVEVGQKVKVGEPQIERSYSPSTKQQKTISFEIFASLLNHPMYTDQHCKFVGRMIIDLTNHDGDLNRSVKVSLTFGDTEIVVAAKDEKTGEETNAAIDFLG